LVADFFALMDTLGEGFAIFFAAIGDFTGMGLEDFI
jgi:hypothetical protein